MPTDVISDRIEFADNGRIHFSGNLFFNTSDKTYFPAVIQKIAGTLSLKNTKIEKIDYLEQAGSIEAKGAKSLTSLARLETVDDRLNLEGTSVQNLFSLLYVGEELKLKGLTTLQSLDSLSKVGRMDIRGTRLKSLNKLREVIVLDAEGVATLEDLPRLKKAVDLRLKETSLIGLPSLNKVSLLNAENVDTFSNLSSLEKARSLLISGTSVEELPRLVEVIEDLEARDSLLAEAPLLKNVGGDCILENSQVVSLPKLEIVGMNLNLRKVDSLTSLPSLRRVFGDLSIPFCYKIESLPSLRKVGGNFDAFHASKLTSLQRLASVLGKLNLVGTQIEKLDNLETVQGDLVLRRTESLGSLPKLETVGGSVDISYSSVQNFPWLRSILGSLSLEGTQITDFTQAMPEIQSIGTNGRGVSVYVNKGPVADQIKTLKNNTSNVFEGEIVVI
jgi:Leucine-rich repeat (LRR) protein